MQPHKFISRTCISKPFLPSSLPLQATKKCPQCVVLWRLSSEYELASGNVTKARSLIEKGRLRVPRCPELWLAAVRIEADHGDREQAKAIMARALQECPKVRMEGKEERGGDGRRAGGRPLLLCNQHFFVPSFMYIPIIADMYVHT